MMILERLRTETRALHEQTEQLLYADSLRGGTLSPDEYRHLLLTHTAFHAALEPHIDQYPAFFRDYQPDTRRKTPWLLADLEQLQLERPVVRDVFADWQPLELLGAAYVAEGSMLGGKLVWHYLQQSPELQPLLQTARFYRGYGSDTGPNWRSFGAFVTRQATDQPDTVVSAAGRAFQAYHTLFRQTAPTANQVVAG